jgi:O-antigen/teichoic acid export membrane protein
MRYFKNTSWMFAEQALRMIAGMFVGILVARYLGPEQFGIFSYALAFVAIFSSFAKLGLDTIVIRNLVNNPIRRDVYLGTAFWLKFIGALVTFAIIAVTSLFTNNDQITITYICIIACGIIFQSFEVVDFYFQSKVLSKYVSISKITQLLFSSLIKIFLVLSNADLFWFVIVSLIDQITLSISLYIAYKLQKDIVFINKFDFKTAKNFLYESWPLICSCIVYVIYSRIDQILIKEMLGVRDVGIYAASLRLSEVWFFIPVLITNSLFPAIVNAKKESEALYLLRLQRLYILLAWIAILIILPIYFFSNEIVVFLYGKEFSDSAIILKIHVVTLFFVFMWTGSAQFIIVESRFLFAFFRNALGLVVNVTSNMILIPKYGINGAAFSSLFGFIASSSVANLIYKPMRETFFMQLKALFIPVSYIRKIYEKRR